MPTVQETKCSFPVEQGDRAGQKFKGAAEHLNLPVTLLRSILPLEQSYMKRAARAM